jgi:hypothetical protein
MQADLECQGNVALGPLPEETARRLARFAGNWLEFDPRENAIVVRHVQPTGCPAMSGIPCELITILDFLPGDARDAVPGGELFIIGHETAQLVRLRVERGEVRIQWAHPDYSAAVPIELRDALEGFNPRAGKVDGQASFSGSAAAAASLEAFIARFEGLYPEGDFTVGCAGPVCTAQFSEVNVGPQELLATLQKIASPGDSLEADLDISSFAHRAIDRRFRINIRQGRVQVLKPALWREA